MIQLLLLGSAAFAAPTKEDCQRWAGRLQAAAATAMANLSSVEDPRVQGLSGKLAPGAVLSEVKAGVCHVQTVGIVDLQATLTVKNPTGGRPLTCPVKVTRAVVPLQIAIAGTAAAPAVQSTTLPVQALAPFMQTCAKASWVPQAVVQVAAGFVSDQQPTWHRQLEAWLAAG